MAVLVRTRIVVVFRSNPPLEYKWEVSACNQVPHPGIESSVRGDDLSAIICGRAYMPSGRRSEFAFGSLVTSESGNGSRELWPVPHISLVSKVHDTREGIIDTCAAVPEMSPESALYRMVLNPLVRVDKETHEASTRAAGEPEKASLGSPVRIGPGATK